MTEGTLIGPPMWLLFATNSVLYGLKSSDSDIYQYQGVANDWIAVGGPAKQFVTNWNNLYRLDSNGDVSIFQGNPGTDLDHWTKIGERMSFLIAGGPALYGVDSATGNIRRYEGIPMGWTEIGGPGYQFVTNGRHLFGISPTQSGVYEYTDTPPGWKQVGGPAEQLVIADNALYAITTDGSSLVRYQGENVWQLIGEGWAQFASLGVSLYAVSKDGSMVGQFDGKPGAWTQFAGKASAIAADSKSVFITNNEGVFEYNVVTNVDVAVDEQTDGTLETRSVTTSEPWVWSFKTSNSYFAGYDGHISMTLFNIGHSFEDSITLPRTHFARGKIYFMELAVTTDVLPLDGISLGGEENFFDDQWNLDSVTAYDPNTFNLYKFDVHKKIPNSGTVSVKPTSVTTVHTPPSGYVTVFVWNYLGKDVAWGHASLQLSDGTYISWWPQGQNRQSIPLIPQIYTVAANPNQTYADDVRLEDGKDPDWRVLVGGLNQSLIEAWWKSFKPTHQWSTLSQNCATTVADALWAGGAGAFLSDREMDTFSSVEVWTPNTVLAFAQAMN